MAPFNHPFNYSKSVSRLLNEYKEHGKLYVAFDFDNTIFDYHNTGGDFSGVISLLKECSKLGFVLILFTSNEGKRLDWMIEYCKHFGIAVDYINENPEIMNTRKPYYNILLDDRAGLECAFNQLSNVISLIKSEKDASIKFN